MSTKALLHAVERIRAQLGQCKPRVDFRLSPEWAHIRSIVLQASVPFPDAALAVADVMAHIDGLRCPSGRDIEILIGRALWPFMDARIVIAEALVDMPEAQTS